MATVRVEVNQADIERIKEDLRHIRNGGPTVVMRALNKAADGVRTDMVAIARGKYSIKAGAARNNISVKKANTSDLSAWTESKGRPIALIDFKVLPSTVQPKRKAQINAEVILGEKKPVEHAFVAVMPTGHKGVFKRNTKKRLPIRELYGPRIEDVYSTDENQQKLQEEADKRMMAELEHQVDYLFKQRMGLL